MCLTNVKSKPFATFAALREEGRLVVERTVLEAKDEMTLYAIAFRDLCQLTIREALAFEGAQREKPVQQTFRVPDRHLFSGCCSRREQECTAKDKHQLGPESFLPA